MGWFGKLLSRSLEANQWNKVLSAFVAGEDMGVVPTEAGVPVTEENALAVTTVYACVNIIAKNIAMLPLNVMERVGEKNRRVAVNHPVFDLLHSRPNSELTSFDWRMLTSIHQNLWGAGISEIEFNNAGTPVALWPIPPWRVEPKKTAQGSVFYRVRLDETGAKTKDLRGDQVVVFRAPTTSSYEWKSPIQTCAETVGYAKAVQDFGSKTFSQGTNPAGVIEFPGKLREGSEESLRKQFSAAYEGLSNAHRLMFLEDGMAFKRVGLPPEDAQYLESKKWTVPELARIWSVPLHLLQHTEQSTTWGSGLEELNAAFLTYTLQPHLAQWTQEFNRRMFPMERDPNRYYTNFNVLGLLRGRLTERYAAYVQGRQNGWLSANDIRTLEDLNPIPTDQGGDEYLVQLNMQKMGDVGNAPEPTEPAPTEPDNTEPEDQDE